MKIIHPMLLFFLIIFSAVRTWGQAPAYVPDEILVRIVGQRDPIPLLIRYSQKFTPNTLLVEKQVATALNIWLLKVSDNKADTRQILDWLKQQPEIITAQHNHYLEQRSIPPVLLPNDPMFSQQWQHLNTGTTGGLPDADMDSEEAWEITTGGLTPDGDTIVVAVIDNGIDYEHEDLTGNMWRNYQEIPNDGVDNDNNGYTDDYLGWNVYHSNDNIKGLSTTHGTPVSAVIGAKGNNGKGVTGINWSVKLMFVAGNKQESAILEAYDYVLNARKRYNATNGAEGSFVVAVNCSWGINYGQPSSSPLWCAAFDSLGAAGILSVAATANSAIDVDVEGDLPTACPSDYLISVTNLDYNDLKPDNAAWGATTIDIGAYGKNIVTAGAGSTYGSFSGTSFAAPNITGAIALLYAAPCDNLIQMAKADPAATALHVKNLLLESATPNASLAEITVSGGRLNCGNLLNIYENGCAECVLPFGIKILNSTTTSLQLDWSTVSTTKSVDLKWRNSGSPTWTLLQNVTPPFLMVDLDTCTEYWVSMRSNCNGPLSSSWTLPMRFRTEGCCEAPTALKSLFVGRTNASLNWEGPDAATSFLLRIRPEGGNWSQYTSYGKTFEVTNLIPCALYEVEVISKCSTDSISPIATYQFKTAGCGACTDENYCEAKSQSAQNEWIQSIELGPWSNVSTGNAGYEDFTTTNGDIPEIQPNKELPIILTPAFSGQTYPEYFRVYIDYNADGDFDDKDELAFDPGFASNTQISGVVVTPEDMIWGQTRMRVMMKYKTWQTSPPEACETFEFGQVEDYCVHLGPSVFSVQQSKQLENLLIYPQPATHWAWVRLPDELYCQTTIGVLDPLGQTVFQQKLEKGQKRVSLDVSNYNPGIYLVYLQSENDKQQPVLSQKMVIVR